MSDFWKPFTLAVSCLISSASSSTVLAEGLTLSTVVTEGLTFSVADDGRCELFPPCFTHFHSKNDPSYGFQGKAEVGRLHVPTQILPPPSPPFIPPPFIPFFNEEIRGLSEFPLSDLSAALVAVLTFQVFKEGGLFDGFLGLDNSYPFSGQVDLVAYVGNSFEDLSDFDAIPFSRAGAFTTTGLKIGDTLRFDVTRIYNQSIAQGYSALGLRLIADPTITEGAWTFDTFRLITVTPEPETYLLMLLGLAAIGRTCRKHPHIRGNSDRI